MANINNLKLGNGNPDALMLDKPYVPLANQDLVLSSIIPKDNSDINESPEGTWEINDDWDVEFIDNGKTIKINKFKIDTWGIRHKVKSSSTNADKYKNIQCRIKGLTYVNQYVIKANANSEEVTGFTNAYTGDDGWVVEWYPGIKTSGNYVKGLVIQGQMVYTDSWNDARNSSYAMGRAPWEINATRDRIVEDGIRPIGMMTGGSCSAFCIALFGGCQTATAVNDNSNGAYRVYDISNNPIYIYLNVEDTTAAIDYSSVEVWDAYVGDTQVYHKDKTIDNCLKKYKYLKEVTKQLDDGSTLTQKQIIQDSSMGDNIIVPVPVDFEELFGSVVSFNIKAANSEFWDVVKQYASTKGLLIQGIDNNIKGTFQGCNMDGSITIKVKNIDNCSGDRMFENCPISEINFTYSEETIPGQSNNMITSINTLFMRAGSLKTITSAKDLGARDMSGCFEFCSSIEEIPGIIDYSYRTYNSINIGANAWCNLTQYFCDGANSLKKIDRYRNATSRESDSNVIKMSSGRQSFNACNNLETIDPILDFEYVLPTDSQLVFAGCTKLTDVRIRNLNHGDWHFDGTTYDGTNVHGDIPALNQESVEYLFSHLKDLTTRNPDMVLQNDPDESGYNGNQYAANPDVDHANLYCPSAWDSYITSEMVSAANAKGWTIYVGGTIKTSDN